MDAQSKIRRVLRIVLILLVLTGAVIMYAVQTVPTIADARESVSIHDEFIEMAEAKGINLKSSEVLCVPKRNATVLIVNASFSASQKSSLERYAEAVGNLHGNRRVAVKFGSGCYN